MNSDNIFFDVSKLKSCGKNVIIGKTVRIRYPELVEIGDNVIIDDFIYISTQLKMANNSHISCGCKLIGGRNSYVEIGEYSDIACNAVIVAGSDDYTSGLTTPMVPLKYKANAKIGRIVISRHCIVGSGSVVLPNVTMHDGASVGALSLVNKDLEEFTLYAGIPVRKIKQRNKKEILELEQLYKNGE